MPLILQIQLLAFEAKRLRTKKSDKVSFSDFLISIRNKAAFDCGASMLIPIKELWVKYPHKPKELTLNFYDYP